MDLDPELGAAIPVDKGIQGRESSTAHEHPPAPATPLCPPEGAQQPTAPNESQIAAIPAQPHPPPGLGGTSAASGSSLTLNDLFHTLRDGFRGVNERFERQGKDLSRLVAEQKETKEIAAQALTLADKTQKDLRGLTERVSNLERQIKNPPLRGAGTPWPATAFGMDVIGGEHGNEAVLGRFPQYASGHRGRRRGAHTKEVLPDEMGGYGREDNHPWAPRTRHNTYAEKRSRRPQA